MPKYITVRIEANHEYAEDYLDVHPELMLEDAVGNPTGFTFSLLPEEAVASKPAMMGEAMFRDAMRWRYLKQMNRGLAAQIQADFDKSRDAAGETSK